MTSCRPDRQEQAFVDDLHPAAELVGCRRSDDVQIGFAGDGAQIPLGAGLFQIRVRGPGGDGRLAGPVLTETLGDKGSRPDGDEFRGKLAFGGAHAQCHALLDVALETCKPVFALTCLDPLLPERRYVLLDEACFDRAAFQGDDFGQCNAPELARSR
ncbi:hypothetical protein [Roseibium sp.]|uniref:hypothetical protein n=1 Tax=Roseibium sp. TaxID=1936156 RepID=UPI003A96E305